MFRRLLLTAFLTIMSEKVMIFKNKSMANPFVRSLLIVAMFIEHPGICPFYKMHTMETTL